jgi:hypothetical protein
MEGTVVLVLMSSGCVLVLMILFCVGIDEFWLCVGIDDSVWHVVLVLWHVA